MIIDGKTKLYGLIGWPVGHTFSPFMHDAAFRDLKINAVYIPLPVKEENFKEALKGLCALGFKGINVTIPYKEKVIPYLSEIDSSASLIGAVNTVIIKDGKFFGYNTDWMGVLSSLKNDAGFDIKGKKVFIFGAGGAAKAVVFALLHARADNVYVTDIAVKKARNLVSQANKNFKNKKVEFLPSVDQIKVQEKIKEADLVVNATGVGMRAGDSALVKPRWIRKEQLAYDLIYNPPLTNFLRAYKQKGAGVLNGEGLLLYQGVKAFELFTSKTAPVQVMKKALKKHIKSF